MSFKCVNKPHYRFVDEERGIELGIGPGMWGQELYFIHKIDEPEEKLGGAVEIVIAGHDADAEDKKMHGSDVEWIVVLTIIGTWSGGAGIQIKGYSRQETIEILKEALLSTDTKPEKALKKAAYEIEFSPYIKKWAKGEE